MSIFPVFTEGGWQSWGQWKQSAPGVRARIRTKDAQDQCPNKYQGIKKNSITNIKPYEIKPVKLLTEKCFDYKSDNI